MVITVSSPGSPGTSFTDNVKDKIVTIFDVLESSDDFDSIRDLGRHLEPYGFNWNYTRNILPFLQNCGIVNYQNVSPLYNKSFFTNIGHAYVDILKSIQIIKDEQDCPDRDSVLAAMESIQEAIYFQCLVIMMKDKTCNYSKDFFDVLLFADKYGYIDSVEYLLIQYERDRNPDHFMETIGETVQAYRAHEIDITVRTKTKNQDSGEAKSVNSFPYVAGNFVKAGVFIKSDDNHFSINAARRAEVNRAIKEVTRVWQA